MKVIEKMLLLDRIGRELQSQMGYSDINVYLTAHGVNCKDFTPSTNSKWIYVKELLANADESLLIKIADELKIDHNYSNGIPKETTVWKVGQFKLFLSHLASFKEQTARLQQSLGRYGITSFVAHEDIEPSKEWQIEIELALHTMDAMAVLLIPGFKESNWCDQEIGVAVGRNVLIIPIRRGLDPYGFIGKYQGIQGLNKNIGDVAKEVFDVIVKSPKTRGKIITSLANIISQSTKVEDALEKALLFQSIGDLPTDLLESMKISIAQNNILINSKLFINEINKLFTMHAIGKLSVGGIVKAPELNDDIPF